MRLTRGQKFCLEGFDRYPDISETPTGILSADFEGAMFLKSSMHIMLTEWFGMEHISNPLTADKTEANVVIIMESGFQNLQEKLRSFASSGPSIAVVLCSAYPPGSIPTSYGTLKILYIPPPYGPYKMARALYHAFTSQNVSENIISELNGNLIPEICTPSTVQQSDLPKTSLVPDIKSHESSDYVSPTSEVFAPANPAQFILPFSIDRRISIDTSVIQSDGLRVLLVEDNEINLKLLVAYMRKLKLNHSTAINGLEALNTYKEADGRFDVIFMGEFSRYASLLRYLRSEPLLLSTA